VFSQAAAYGLPVVTTETGGTLGIVRHGETGFLLPPDAGGIDDAQIIYKIYQDEYRYQELVCNSRKAYDEGLNWDNWGGKMATVMARHYAHG
ncbi:uncharacterized protein METZ01_LOCUS405444, partial [marine metagenome]